MTAEENKLALSALAHCELCPRRCGADRLRGGRGYCGAGRYAKASLVSLHQWEEPCIAGDKGAGTVFFAHCNLGCVFCQNSLISRAEDVPGYEVEEERLAEIFLEQQERGAETLDLVTPTHYAPQIVAALAMARENGFSLPVVWNSSGYELAETVPLLSAAGVSVFLPDVKYYTAETAARYAGAGDYFAAARAAVTAMVRAAGEPRFNENGIMTGGVLVRHLVLPGKRRESMAILKWLWDSFGSSIRLSLMNQYIPLGRAAEFKEINRRLTTFEYESVTDYALELGFAEEQVYVQGREAATAEYVPEFDGRGVLAKERRIN